MAKIPEVKFPTYEEMAKNVAEKALDNFFYKGKTIREWMQIIAEQDAISRQAAIMAMNELHVTDRDVYGMELSKCFDNDRANGKLLSLPPVQPTSGWIPVSERLPENIRPVIVTWKNNNPESYYQHIVGKHFIGVAHYLKGKWYWYSSTTEDFLAEYGRYEGEEFDEAIEVIAWQPLPEPYTEGEK